MVEGDVVEDISYMAYTQRCVQFFMNRLLTTILLTISSLVLAQTKQTCFEWTGGNQTDWFCFQDSVFKHLNKTHESYCYGEGRFIETSDSLKFQYSDYVSNYKILESEVTSSDSIKIFFKIIEIDSQHPVENASVFVERLKIGGVTDSLGNGGTVLSKNEIHNSDELRIRSIAYPDKYISLQEFREYRKVIIEIWVSERVSFYSKKDHDSYVKLLKSNRGLQFKNEHGYVYNFRLISSKKFSKIFDRANIKR